MGEGEAGSADTHFPSNMCTRTATHHSSHQEQYHYHLTNQNKKHRQDNIMSSKNTSAEDEVSDVGIIWAMWWLCNSHDWSSAQLAPQSAIPTTHPSMFLVCHVLCLSIFTTHHHNYPMIHELHLTQTNTPCPIQWERSEGWISTLSSRWGTATGV